MTAELEADDKGVVSTPLVELSADTALEVEFVTGIWVGRV